jgi:hypothetical protein
MPVSDPVGDLLGAAVDNTHALVSWSYGKVMPVLKGVFQGGPAKAAEGKAVGKLAAVGQAPARETVKGPAPRPTRRPATELAAEMIAERDVGKYMRAAGKSKKGLGRSMVPKGGSGP